MGGILAHFGKVTAELGADLLLEFRLLAATLVQPSTFNHQLSTRIDTSLTLSILRKCQLINWLHYPALEYFDTSAVYRGRCANKVLEKADVQLFKVQSSRFEVQCFSVPFSLGAADRLSPPSSLVKPDKAKKIKT